MGEIMNGLTAVKQQTDDDFDLYSEETATDTSGMPDRTRQEDAKFTNINYQLKMFGLNPFAQRQPTFGAVDYRIDLTTAKQATEDARYAWKRLPAALREKYPTWVKLLHAAEAGELANIDLTTGENKPLTKEPAPVTVPPAPPNT